MYYIGNGLTSPFMGRFIDKTKRKGLFMGLGLLALDLTFILFIIPFPYDFALFGISTIMFFVGVFFNNISSGWVSAPQLLLQG